MRQERQAPAWPPRGSADRFLRKPLGTPDTCVTGGAFDDASGVPPLARRKSDPAMHVSCSRDRRARMVCSRARAAAPVARRVRRDRQAPRLAGAFGERGQPDDDATLAVLATPLSPCNSRSCDRPTVAASSPDPSRADLVPVLRGPPAYPAMRGRGWPDGPTVAEDTVVRHAARRRGTSLVEAVTGIAILAVAVVSLAGLAAVAMRSAALARDRTAAAILAAQKLEQLRLAPIELAESSADAVTRDVAGFVEYLDASGAPVAPSPPAGGLVFVRRWAVSAWSGDGDLQVLGVVVTPCRGAAVPPGQPCGDPRASVALATLRPRTAW